MTSVCESRCQHVGREKSENNTGDGGSPRSCASLKHGNKIGLKMHLLLYTSAGTPQNMFIQLNTAIKLDAFFSRVCNK